MKWSDGIRQSASHDLFGAGGNGIGGRQRTRWPDTATEFVHHLEDVVGEGRHVPFAIDFLHSPRSRVLALPRRSGEAKVPPAMVWRLTLSRRYSLVWFLSLANSVIG